MTDNPLADYIDHMLAAASDAHLFTKDFSKEDFFAGKRPPQAVVMSLVILGEAATKIMEKVPVLAALHLEGPCRGMRGLRNSIAHGYSDSIWMPCGRLFRPHCRNLPFNCEKFNAKSTANNWAE